MSATCPASKWNDLKYPTIHFSLLLSIVGMEFERESSSSGACSSGYTTESERDGL